jgi:hypothetical protein
VSRTLVAALLVAALASSPEAGEPSVARTEERAKCIDHDPLRRPFFGDLHVHTALSLDASTQGTRNRPADAYRFARGERIGVQPYAPDGTALREMKLARPLDFAAVTDHAELLGEAHICSSPGLDGYDSWICRIYRSYPRLAFFVMNYRVSRGDAAEPPERFDFCSEGGAHCLEAARAPWTEVREAAEAAYDKSPECRFTTLVGYEWTGAAGPGNNLHRNVLFRNAVVPELPSSFVDTPAPELLWRKLRETCLDADTGCDALVIPHNSNLSGGKMFATTHPDGAPISADEARMAAELEPVVEIMQHKGSSECMRGVDTADELCSFETLEMSNFSGRYVPYLAEKPVPRQFVREILREGLVQEQRLGVNPFKFGIVASTDTHLGASGAAEEDGAYTGHGGAGNPARDEIPKGLPDAWDLNPGGLAVIWSEENSRDALFQALRRKEVYGTSGPRHVVRFFGGFGYDADLCRHTDLAARGYAGGVPMGGDLPAAPAGAAPRFVLSALRDPGTDAQPGTRLQRLQVVKGWLAADGKTHERVYDIAGHSDDRADVDLASCQPRGPGADALCAVWTDPDFDPAERAVWYARVIENPTCRWTTRVCNAGGVRCDDPASVGEGFEACCDAKVPKTVQERSWTSPIWFTPAKADGGPP